MEPDPFTPPALPQYRLVQDSVLTLSSQLGFPTAIHYLMHAREQRSSSEDISGRPLPLWTALLLFILSSNLFLLLWFSWHI